MDELENQLKEFANKLKNLNLKVKLISLIENAKQEYNNCDLKACRELLLQVKNIDSTQAVVWRGLGCLKQSEGNFQSALVFYKKALEFSEHKELEFTLIGTIYYLLDNLDEAIRYFQLAIDENEDYEQAYEGRNQAMLENQVKLIDLQETLKKYF